MDLKLGTSIHNRFDIRVIRDGKVIQEAQAENIVLDRMYTRICQFATYFDYIHFGTGTGTQSASRTTLFTPKSYKSASTVETVYAYPISKITRKIQINPSEYVGSSFTEVGISESTSSINTHALIKDSEGNQISITKTALDLVEIYATVYIELNNSDSVYFIKPASSNTLLNYFLTNAGTTPSSSISTYAGFSSSVGAEEARSSMASLSVTRTSNSTTKVVNWPSIRFEVNNSNGDITKVGIPGVLRATFPKTGVYTGTDFTNESLGIGDSTKTCFTLAHKEPSNISVKVDGVDTTDYTLVPAYSGMVGGSYIQLPISAALYTMPNNIVLVWADHQVNLACVYRYTTEMGFVLVQYLPSGYVDFTSKELNEFSMIDGDGKVRYFTWDSGLGKYIESLTDTVPKYTVYMNSTKTFRVCKANDYYGTRSFYRYDSGKWSAISTSMTYSNTSEPYISNTGFLDLGENYYLVNSPNVDVGLYVLHFDEEAGTLTQTQIVTQNSSASSTNCFVDGYLIVCTNLSTGVHDIYKWDNVSHTFNIFQRDLNIYIANSNGARCGVSVEEGFIVIVPSVNTYQTTVRYLVLNPITGVFDVIVDGLSYASLNAHTYAGLTDDGTVIMANSQELYAYDIKARKKAIKFNTPPASGAVITASYHTDVIPKTTDYVLDVGFTLQFGEGTV